VADSKVLVVCNFEQENHISLPDGCDKLLLSNYAHEEKTDRLFKPYEIAVFSVN
jgi:hypothetical protein